MIIFSSNKTVLLDLTHKRSQEFMEDVHQFCDDTDIVLSDVLAALRYLNDNHFWKADHVELKYFYLLPCAVALLLKILDVKYKKKEPTVKLTKKELHDYIEVLILALHNKQGIPLSLRNLISMPDSALDLKHHLEGYIAADCRTTFALTRNQLTKIAAFYESDPHNAPGFFDFQTLFKQIKLVSDANLPRFMESRRCGQLVDELNHRYLKTPKRNEQIYV